MSCYTRFLHPLATPACYNHSSFTRFHNIFLQSVSGILDDGTAAGKKHEATKKLYERHYLVIKIVSSFFACLIKFLYL